MPNCSVSESGHQNVGIFDWQRKGFSASVYGHIFFPWIGRVSFLLKSEFKKVFGKVETFAIIKRLLLEWKGNLNKKKWGETTWTKFTSISRTSELLFAFIKLNERYVMPGSFHFLDVSLNIHKIGGGGNRIIIMVTTTGFFVKLNNIQGLDHRHPKRKS